MSIPSFCICSAILLRDFLKTPNGMDLHFHYKFMYAGIILGVYMHMHV